MLWAFFIGLILFLSLSLYPAARLSAEAPSPYEDSTILTPEPIWPRGQKDAPNEYFSWTETKDASRYTLYYEDETGAPTWKTLSNTTEFVCPSGTHTCKSTQQLSVNGGTGKWKIQAHVGNKYSPWSGFAYFGKFLQKDIFERCIVPEGYNVLTGDLNNVPIPGGQLSVGTAIQAQAVRYDLAKHQATFNTGLGAGASFRYYKDIFNPITREKVPVSRIKQDCRAATFRLKNENTLAAPLFSITPTIFASKLDDTSNLTVQPAIMIGFFEDILNIGAGFNLTGKPGEVGHVFLLMSIGMGFQF